MFDLYRMRLKCLLRNKEGLFWCLLFPIVLSTFFNIAFSNLYSGEKFNSIPIAVIDNAAYQKDVAFQSVLKSVESSEDGKKMFKVTIGSEDKVKDLLKSDKVMGYINVEDNYSLSVMESSIDQTIVKSFLDSYRGHANIITSVLKKDPSKLETVTKELMSSNSYIKEQVSTTNEPDTTVNYFYALIAMACLFAADWGLEEVSAIQANQSVQGARINIAPVHKMKLLFCNLLAACTIQFICQVCLLAYLIFALHVEFGNQIPFVMLTSAVGCIAGLTVGAMVSSIITKNKHLKSSILMLVSLGGSFLSGLMISDMKIMIQEKAPIISYINPASLITDALYSLYYYDTHARFFTNIILLCILSIIFIGITYIFTRRRDYASL